LRRTETKDGSSDYFTQCSHRGEKPTCLLRSTCPCPSVTAHLVCHCYSVAYPPFVSPSSPFLLLLPVYSQMICSAITVRSQSLISKCKSRTTMQCLLCRPKALLLPGNCPQPFLTRSAMSMAASSHPSSRESNCDASIPGCTSFSTGISPCGAIYWSVDIKQAGTNHRN
jgi:hypothetical protein